MITKVDEWAVWRHASEGPLHAMGSARGRPLRALVGPTPLGCFVLLPTLVLCCGGTAFGVPAAWIARQAIEASRGAPSPDAVADEYLMALGSRARPQYSVRLLVSRQRRSTGKSAMHSNAASRKPQLPLKGSLDFNAPNEPIRVFEGPFGGIGNSDRPGVVELTFTAGPRLAWRATREDNDLFRAFDPFTMSIRRNGRPWKIPANRSNLTGGWINFAESKSALALDRVIAYWINLPDIAANYTLSESHAGGKSTWSGRLQLDSNDWRITLDRRRDHSKVFENADTSNIYAMTHIMELRRADGRSFSTEEAKQILENLRVSFSFALGRWVSPAFPVGYTASGEFAWESWSSVICDPAKRVGQAVLYHHSREDIIQYLDLALGALNREGTNGSLRFQMVSGVQTSHVGFVEQRIAVAFAALENLSWVTLVLGGRISRADFEGNSWTGAKKLRTILNLASIPQDIQALDLPALKAFASRGSRPPLDGPAALVKVRNSLVHPRSPRDEVYNIPNLAVDAWHLSRYYLNLLILRSIGFNGEITGQLPPFGWYAATSKVPWAPRPNL